MAKTVVLIIISGTLLLSVLSWITAPEIKDIVRFILTCAICYFLYIGRNWARLVLGVLLGLGAAISAYTIVNVSMPVEAVVLLAVMAAFYAASSILLLTGMVVGPYFGKRTA